jgi:hypothetical protein
MPAPTMKTEDIYIGLIDRLVAARNEPITSELLSDAQTGRSGAPMSPQWRAHRDAIDWALDLLVPAAKKLLMLTESPPGSGNVRKVDVERIVGQVPFERNQRFRK